MPLMYVLSMYGTHCQGQFVRLTAYNLSGMYVEQTTNGGHD